MLFLSHISFLFKLEPSACDVREIAKNLPIPLHIFMVALYAILLMISFLAIWSHMAHLIFGFLCISRFAMDACLVGWQIELSSNIHVKLPQSAKCKVQINYI